MTDSTGFRRGDTVVHPRRPEWGEGVVEDAVAIAHEGKPAQRLTVRFTHHGRVTINTGVAPLLSKDAAIPMTSGTTTSSGSGWLNSFGPAKRDDQLYRLPDAMTDPFVSLAKRLQATLDSFRLTPGRQPQNPRQLLDWAVAQTALPDPLSKYTRHELEEGFARFSRERDNHLQELVKLLKKQGQAGVLQEAARTATGPAREGLQRAMQR